MNMKIERKNINAKQFKKIIYSIKLCSRHAIIKVKGKNDTALPFNKKGNLKWNTDIPNNRSDDKEIAAHSDLSVRLFSALITWNTKAKRLDDCNWYFTYYEKVLHKRLYFTTCFYFGALKDFKIISWHNDNYSIQKSGRNFVW